MRLLHLITDLGYGGASGQLVRLAKHLPREQFEQRVAVLHRTGPVVQQLAQAGIAVDFLRQRFPVDPIAFGRLRNLQRSWRPDVVHAWDFNAGDYAALLKRGPQSPRLLQTLRTFLPQRTAWRTWRDHKLIAAADQLLCSCDTVADLWRTAGAPEDKLAILPTIVESSASHLPRAELLTQLNLPADAKLIGVVARLVPRNRIKELIWAADMVRVLHDNMRMLIIGAGPQRDDLVRFARLASDLEHIRFLGPRADVGDILPHCDAVWHNSELPGEPAAVLEAMAAGAPVIVGRAPGRDELLADGGGVTVPPDGRADWARKTDEWFREGHVAASLRDASASLGETRLRNALASYTAISPQCAARK